VYRIGRIFIFRNSPGIDLNTQVQANFTLPEVNKLADEARSCSLDILFVSTATGMYMRMFFNCDENIYIFCCVPHYDYLLAVKNSNLSSGVNSNSMPSDMSHLAFFECELCFNC